MGDPAPETTENPFTDVPDGTYYTDAVLWAAEQGITSGTSATTFSPNKPCTRGEFVTFLYRAAQSPVVSEETTNPFSDVKDGKYYYTPVLWALEHQVTKGTSETTFSPGKNCTRGEIVTFLWRFLD